MQQHSDVEYSKVKLGILAKQSVVLLRLFLSAQAGYGSVQSRYSRVWRSIA